MTATATLTRPVFLMGRHQVSVLEFHDAIPAEENKPALPAMVVVLFRNGPKAGSEQTTRASLLTKLAA